MELNYQKEGYNEKSCGFLEFVYQESLEWELELKGIPYASQVELGLSYKGNPLRSKFVPDFICFEKIILEIKAVSALADQQRAQVHNYLKATGTKLGLLVNFGSHPDLEVERIVRTQK